MNKREKKVYGMRVSMGIWKEEMDHRNNGESAG